MGKVWRRRFGGKSSVEMFLGKFQCPKSGGKFQAVRRKWAKLSWVKKKDKRRRRRQQEKKKH